jgi:hypothetical protein
VIPEVPEVPEVPVVPVVPVLAVVPVAPGFRGPEPVFAVGRGLVDRVRVPRSVERRVAPGSARWRALAGGGSGAPVLTRPER